MKFKLSFNLAVLICISFLLTCSNYTKESAKPEKIPVIFSKHYNIKFLGLEKLHPYDTEKAKKIRDFLIKKHGIDKEQFYEPEKVSENVLLEVHTKEYLKSLNHSAVIADIAEVPRLEYIPAFILKNVLLKSMKYAVGGTLLGTDVALIHGMAINLSGGFHHAKANSGEGFSFFADINLAINRLNNKHNIKKILVVDLDAHQGNGYESIVKNDSNIVIFDVYNEEIFPDDNDVKQYIDYNFPIINYTKDSTYLNIIEENLPVIIKKTQPEFIIYNAGTDIYKGDLLGNLSISAPGIIKRDQLVFKYAQENQIPVLMLLSGGYSKASAYITAISINNILNRFYFKKKS